MKFHPFEVSIPHIIYAALGGFVVFFGMFSLFIREKLYIGEACWAFLFGVVIGPYGVNIFDPRSWGNGDNEVTNTITLEFTRVVLAIGVFAIGVELPKAYMARHWRSLFFLLAPVMTWGWFVSAALIFAFIPKLNFLSSLAVAACLTPTDPILAAAVVGGKYADKHVPAHLRHLLAAESGCNDGAAYPFLWIALYLTIDKTTGHAISDWFLLLWLYQVILGIVFGACLGIGFRYLMRFCERKDLIDRQSYVAQYISLAMLTIGSCTLLGTDDLLAAFSCGTAFAWDGFFNKQTEEAVFSSVIDLLFNIAAFVFVGAWIPFNAFSDAALSLSVWRLIVIAILVILLRRLPVMIALYKWIPDVKTLREAFFSGHFGPMGVGAIFISTLAAEQLPHPHSPPENQQELLAATIQPIVAFMVLCSILIHGLSIPFFSLGRRVHSVSRTWSRHDTFGQRQHSLPEWANLTRFARPQDIVVNRDATDVERGLGGDTVHGEESPMEKASASSSSGTAAHHEQDVEVTREQDIEARRGGGGEDMRVENPPDGTEIIAEWKEGPHKIVERRAGPGEEVEVEVQRNAFGPDDTTFHSARAATEEAAHGAINEIRNKLSKTLSPQMTRGKVHEAALAVQDTVHHDAEQMQHVVEAAEQKTKDFVGSVPHPHTQASQDEGEDEGWVSDREEKEERRRAVNDNEAQAGSSSSAIIAKSQPVGSSPLRAKSKSPKIKPPKLALLRPVTGSAGRRRQSMRKSLLGVRPLTIGRPHLDESLFTPPGEDSPSHADASTSPITPLSPDYGVHWSGDSPGTSNSDSPRRGRHSTPTSSPIGTPTPTSATPPATSSLRGIRHARVHSLRSSSIGPDSHSSSSSGFFGSGANRRSIRDSSPARSVRWADSPETEYPHGRSGTSTPRAFGSSTPAPGSEAGSEAGSEVESEGQQGQVHEHRYPHAYQHGHRHAHRHPRHESSGDSNGSGNGNGGGSGSGSGSTNQVRFSLPEPLPESAKD